MTESAWTGWFIFWHIALQLYTCVYVKLVWNSACENRPERKMASMTWDFLFVLPSHIHDVAHPSRIWEKKNIYFIFIIWHIRSHFFWNNCVFAFIFEDTWAWEHFLVASLVLCMRVTRVTSSYRAYQSFGATHARYNVFWLMLTKTFGAEMVFLYVFCQFEKEPHKIRLDGSLYSLHSDYQTKRRWLSVCIWVDLIVLYSSPNWPSNDFIYKRENSQHDAFATRNRCPQAYILATRATHKVPVPLAISPV